MEKDKMKTPRASQSREQTKRPTTWTPPSSLDAPPKTSVLIHPCPNTCLLYTSPSPRDRTRSRMPSSA